MTEMELIMCRTLRTIGPYRTSRPKNLVVGQKCLRSFIDPFRRELQRRFFSLQPLFAPHLSAFLRLIRSVSFLPNYDDPRFP